MEEVGSKLCRLYNQASLTCSLHGDARYLHDTHQENFGTESQLGNNQTSSKGVLETVGRQWIYPETESPCDLQMLAKLTLRACKMILEWYLSVCGMMILAKSLVTAVKPSQQSCAHKLAITLISNCLCCCLAKIMQCYCFVTKQIEVWCQSAFM